VAEEERTPIKLHDLRPPAGARSKKVRVGRGEGGRRGKTAGRGTKGQKARGTTRLGFEGGQLPLVQRVPKAKGFRNPFRVSYNVVNVGDLKDLGPEITPELLKEKGVVPHKGLVKVLGDGEITASLAVKAHAFSKSAVAKLEAAGGSAEVVS